MVYVTVSIFSPKVVSKFPELDCPNKPKNAMPPF